MSQAAIDSFRRAFNEELSPNQPGLTDKGFDNDNWAIHQGLVAAAPYIEGIHE